MTLKQFIFGIFSEPQPTGQNPSASRLTMFLFAVAVVVWISYFLHVNKQLPPGGTIWDLAGFVASPYIVNQGRAVLGDFSRK